jgi:phosphoglucomutase
MAERQTNNVPISGLAGQPAPGEMLVDLVRLERDYYLRRPDMDDASQQVIFGTSGHRGSSLRGSFTEAHLLAITQAICDYRGSHGSHGPIYRGKDTHALSGPAQCTALDVLAGEPITAKPTRAPGNNSPIGGLKVVAANGWFAARPSGTENLYKIYAESFKDEAHLNAIAGEAREMANKALGTTESV